MENDIDDGCIAQGKQNLVICTQILLQPMEKGMADTTEVHTHGKHVGGNGVHAVYFQPSGVLSPSFVVDDVVEKGHEQEAITAAYQYHRTSPNFLDDRMPDSPNLAEGNHHTTYYKQISQFLSLFQFFILQYISGKCSRKYGYSEIKAA